MLLRKRNSPGIEINEIDRSQYNRLQDYSIVNTTTLVCGFADKGENYTTKWINTKQTFEDEYGYPTNEVEKYFYNAAVEVLNNGGVLLASKLPYNNNSKDKFSEATYKVFYPDTTNNDFYISELQKIDTSISSYIQISADNTVSNLITIETLDNYKTNNSFGLPNNTIKIVDITQQQYGKLDLIRLQDIKSDGTEKGTKIYATENVECLGIMPVLVSPINALYFQNIISDNISTLLADHDRSGDFANNENIGKQISENISAYNPIINAVTRKNIQINDYMDVDKIQDNFSVVLCSNYINDNTVSKMAASYFPSITFTHGNQLNKKYLKQIGVVVFNVFKDNSENGKICFKPVESFIGSLNKTEKDPTTKQSIYIDNIINTQSKYINFFSNVKTNENSYKNRDIILIANETSRILGYTEEECEKKVNVTESILKPLSRIFDVLQDPNYVNIDIVCDAGVSNIGQYVNNFSSNNDININQYPFFNGQTIKWELTDIYHSRIWKSIIEKYDTFCKKQRQDCIFIADGLRPFCLDGNEKIVRNTNLTNTIENNIIPKLRYMTGINSSYSAGYCNWFYAMDAYNDEYFWCPPSIKATGVYIYTDVYFNPWDAPAGINRGKISGVIDTAFSPKNDEAGKIYQQSWNYAVNYPIDGIILEGQKTFQIEATALDRVNVRRLLLYLKRNVNNVARKFLYEGNTEYIRQRFVDTIRPFFENAKNRYGLNDYVIRCDDILNTPEVIDRNELHCKIAIKPVKTIEWIICNFIVTNQSANVKEEVLN